MSRDLFDEWSTLNKVMSDTRSRFDGLREAFAVCTTRVDAMAALEQEGYQNRYPLLPEWLQ